ncbi:hypothetical protein U0070_025654, partial [Myodes glareolus]
MSLKAPHTILEMAVKSLLKNKDFDISVLQQMHEDTDRIGGLMAFCMPPCGSNDEGSRCGDITSCTCCYCAIDMLLTQMFHLRRSKLQVLDLRDESNRFWDVWHGLEVRSKKAKTPRYAPKQPMNVVTDFDLKDELHERQAYLLQWAQRQKRSVKLYCMKMTICETPVELIMAILKVFPPESVEELELSRNWSLATLSSFAPPLDQMRNLHKLHLKRIFMYIDIGTNPLSDREEKCESRFLSKIFKLSCLKHLSMNDVFFSGELLKHLCRSMKCPVESLSIQRGRLSEPDLEHLCLWLRLYQLKYLNLHSLSLLHLSPTHLQFLHEKDCSIRDSQLNALLPALSKCSKLNRVNFLNSVISTSLLKDFLHCKANLSTLTEEFYPAPLECYDQVGHILEDKFTNLCPDLLNILRSKRHPKKGLFLTKFCHKCVRFCVYDLGTCHK